MRHFDPVAEHAGEAHAEGRDSGAGALTLFEPRDPRARLSRFAHERTKPFVPSLTDQPAVVQRERWLLDERLGEERAQLRERNHVDARRGQQRDRRQRLARVADAVERDEAAA